MQSFTANNTAFYFQSLGSEGARPFYWGHGWGQSHGAFMPLVQSLERLGHHNVLDLPAFGKSPRPQKSWRTEDYADAIAAHLKAINSPPIIWAGHSFGGRVGVQLASRHPELVAGLVLIAGAGLKRKRGIFKSLYFKIRIGLYKFLKKLIPLGLSQDWLQSKFGSRDYKNANEIRDIFLATISEDLSEAAKKIKSRTILIYGERDTETPPEFGQRYHALISNSELHILGGLDHYSVLGNGRHQVANLIQDFVKKLP